MKKITFLLLLTLNALLMAQNPVQVGSGSYAEYPTPQAAAVDFYGSSYQNRISDPAPFFVHERMQGQPIPTNDWTTDIIWSQYCGEVWAYPHMITSDAQGTNVVFPGTVYVDGWGSQVSNEDVYLSFRGAGFAPGSSIAYDWNDIAFTMQSRESDVEYINTTFGHGLPFVWAEYEGITTPQITASAAPVAKNINGNNLTFPVTTSVFTLTFGGVTYGVHLPTGTVVSRAGNTFSFAFSGANEYVVVSMLPAESFVSTFNAVARNKPTNTLFTYDYTPVNGTVSTTFTLETENLDNGVTGGESMFALMPHHWRNTTLDKTLIPNAEYTGVFGTLKCVQGTSVQIDYVIPGMPAVMPAPNNLNPTQLAQLNALITSRVNAGVNAGNTYAKSLGEGSQMMLYAKELGHPGYETLKASLKAELINWFTYSPGETTGKFFAMYPEIGAYVGFPPGYGSQIMNDHNFHNGYYIIGAARLMLVDEDFKAQYGEMVIKVAKSYANWLRYGVNDDDFLPFFRSFDPYTGHSWAGGLSGGEGPNQESTSESTNSWFGLYTLGLALEDPEIIKAGAMGFTLEGRATMEYWFDVYNDNYLPNYQEYTGIVFAGRLAFGTWFSGDRGWIFGIQCVPNADFYQYYMTDATSLAEKWEAMLQDRADAGNYTSADPYGNVVDMGEYLGGYHLNYVAAYDPEYAAQLLNQAMNNVGGQWLTGVNAATTMYNANASVSYGLPADGFTTDDYSTGVFYNATSGEYTYISSNYTDEPKTVVIYDNGTPIGHIVVAPNSISSETTLNPGIPPVAQITNLTDNQNFTAGSKIDIEVDASDPDGTIAEVQFWINGVLEFTDYAAPFYYFLDNVQEGTFTVKAIAIDNDGIETTTEEYYLTVGNIPPSVTISNPVSGTTYFVGDDVEITAIASDEDGSIASVTFYENGVQLAVDNTAPYTYSLVNLSLGNHSLQAIAVDNNGKETVSDLVNIVALENCSGEPTTANVGQFTYTISSATSNPRVTYIPTPGNAITFCQIFYSVNGGGEAVIGMTNNGDGTYSANLNASAGSTVGFRFVNNFIGGGGQVFTHTIGENCGDNLAPVANAGADLSVNNTAAFVLVDGSESMDWDGSITTYAWTKVSGPNATLVNANTDVLRVENLEVGTYVFELSVTDDNGASSTDQVTMTVTLGVDNTPALTYITVTPGVQSVQNGDNQQFTAVGYDQYDNVIATTFSWAVSGGGTITQTGLFSATTLGAGFTVTATSGAVSGTATVNVLTYVQVLTSITVTPDGQTVALGNTQQFTANCFDQNGDAMPAPTITWGVSGGGTINASGLFSATTGGTGFTVTASNGAVSGTATVNVTYTPVLTSISVSPDGQGVQLGNNQQFTATGIDQYGNAMAASVTWGVSGGGTIDASGLFSATAGGTGFTVTATSGTTSGTATFDVTYTPVLTSIDVTPDNGSVLISKFLLFTATAYDQYGYEMTTTINWQVSGGGTIDAVGLLSPTTIGTGYTVTATSGAISGTATFNVTNENSTLYADYDNVDLNFTGDNGSVFTKIANPVSGGINTSGQVGRCVNNAGRAAWSALISGPLASKMDFSSQTMFTMKVYCPVIGEIRLKLEDATNMNINTEISVTNTVTNQWEEIQFDLSGAPSNMYDRIVLFFDFGGDLVNANTHYFDDLMLEEPSAPSVLTSILVTPDGQTVNNGSDLQFTAIGYDQYGDPMPATITWAVSGGGTINQSGLFSATTVGTGYTVTASSGAISGTATYDVSIVTSNLAQNKEEQVIAYPTVFSDNLFISIPDASMFNNLSVISVTGQEVYNQSLKGDNLVEINTTDFNSGMYIVILSGEAKEMLKVIKH